MLTKAIDWDKNPQGIPTIVQNHLSGKVLMLGYMNRKSFESTQQCGYVVFRSRKRNRLWKKGETSGNTLKVVRMYTDCDGDAILVSVVANGPTCHLNKESCFDPTHGVDFLCALEKIVRQRKQEDSDCSRTSRLYRRGIRRISQKIGEEGVETSLSSALGDTENLIHESADLIYHLIVALQFYGIDLSQVVDTLKRRRRK